MTTSSHADPGHAVSQPGNQADRTPWRQALDARRLRSKAWPGGKGNGKSRGKGFMPFKATGHKGGISRQG